MIGRARSSCRSRFVVTSALAAWVLTTLAGDFAEASPRPDLAPPPIFRASVWGVAEGLPGTHINSVVQDDEGFLWIGTLAGLVRFDGHSFEAFSEAVGLPPLSRITALHYGTSGTLWVGTEQGYLSAYRDHEFQLYGEPPYSRIAGLVEDAEGTLWVSRYVDPAQSEPLVWQLVGETLVPRADLDRFWISRHPTGRLDIVTHDGGLEPINTRSAVTYLTLDSSGRVWGQIGRGRQVRIPDGATGPPGRPFFGTSTVSGRTVMARRDDEDIDVYLYDENSAHRGSFVAQGLDLLLLDRRGFIWLVDREQRLHIQRAEDSVEIDTLEIGSKIRFATEDREGNVWLGTMTKGLIRVSETAVQSWGPEQGIPLPVAVGLLPSGEVFLEAAPTLPCRPLHHLRGGAKIEGVCSWILTDRQGKSWAFDDGSGETHRIDSTRGSADRPADLSEISRLEIGGDWMIEDPIDDGVLWLTDQKTLKRLDTRLGDHPKVTGSWNLALNRALASDGRGGLWLGSTDGFFRLHENNLERLGHGEGLSSENVRAIHPDGHGGLWLGTYGGGLAHYDENGFTTVGIEQGLPEAVVSSLVEDHFGALWLAGNRGIHRILSSQLNALISGGVTRIEAMSFGRDHGLVNPETTGRPGVAGPDGRIWFSTFGGVVAVDPSVVVRREEHEPQVKLTGVRTATGRVSANTPITVASDAVRDLEFSFSAIHLAAPELLSFRYRLEPLEDSWISVGDRRVASYRSVPPGEYRFRVQARHSAGIWNEAATEQRVTLLPRFHETRWFTLLLAALGLAVIVTAWRISTHQIRVRSQRLEVAVEKRTEALAAERDLVARQASRLGDLAESRSRFMAGISHELRTPLTLILGPLEDLYQQRLGQLPKTANEEIAVTLQNADRLRRLVDRLLGVARNEAELTRLHCREGDLVLFVCGVVKELQPLATRRHSILRFDPPPVELPVWFDPLQLESVVINLVANALKHTPVGSTVEVSLSEAKTSPESILLEVRDNGPGIPEAEVPQLFERFRRGRLANQNTEGGFGLGLALVREVVERHSGSIEVESGPQGSLFTVRLRLGREHLRPDDCAPFDTEGKPLKEPTLAFADDAPREFTAAAEPSPTVAARIRATEEESHDPDEIRMTILVVDDHPDLRRLVRRQLEDHYRVLEMADGRQAMASIETELPDLVLSDVMMPELDGYQLCRAIRENPATNFIPIVLLTARASADSQVEGLERGADAYLAKPFNGDVLRATISGLIASRRRLRDHYAAKFAIDPSSSQSAATPSTLATDDPLHPQESTQPPDEKYLSRVHHAIETHLHDEDLSVDELAKLVYQSRVSLYRHLKRLKQGSPSDLIREARLTRAHQLLTERAGSVNEVAYAVGFKSTAHFSNSFNQRYGVRPSSVTANP